MKGTLILATPKPISTSTYTPFPPEQTKEANILDAIPTFFFVTPTWPKFVTPTRSLTPTLTPTPTSSTTPIVTPVNTLQAHEWFSDNPIAYFNSWDGDGCCQYPSQPALILYSDGQLFINNYSFEGNYDQILTKKLSREEICMFLNTIDQLGFFDYDASSYQIDSYGREIKYYPTDGSSMTDIYIKAWRFQYVSLYGLWTFLVHDELFINWPKESEAQLPTILPALKNTYLFLQSYTPNGLQVYKPEALEIWISTENYSPEDVQQWPIIEPSLAYLIENAQPDDFYGKSKIIVEGAYAQNISETFAYTIQSEVYTDGENTVTLYALPLFPYPSLFKGEFSAESMNNSSTTSVSISCKPSDGQIVWSP